MNGITRSLVSPPARTRGPTGVAAATRHENIVRTDARTFEEVPELSVMDLKAQVRDLESCTAPGTSPIEAERKLARVLEPLLRRAGYTLDAAPINRGYDFIARKGLTSDSGADELVIEYKHYRQQVVSADEVRSLLGSAVLAGVARAMLVTNTRFTRAARESVRSSAPVAIELIDIDALRSWIGRLEEIPALDLREITVLRREVSRKLITLVASHPGYLQGIEWRELEYLLAEVLEKLGFSAEITPGSKDGGRDLVLTCHVASRRHEYYVEIKHWRSGKRVGKGAMREFLNVIINEQVSGGLYLSTHGYCSNAIESLTQIERKQLRFGAEAKIVSLCRTYQKATSGLWTPDADPAEMLFQGTL